MKRIAAIPAMVALALGLAGFLGLRTPEQEPPPAYPCVETSKEGWLTAVGGSLVLRAEWGPGWGRLGVAPENSVVTWRETKEAEARHVALHVLAPVSGHVRSRSDGTASFFVSCDGHGAYWRGTSGTRRSWRECWQPSTETRLECVQRVLSRPVTEQVAGAVIDRITEQGRLAHVAPPPPLPPLPPMSPLLPADDSNDVLPSLDRATDTD